MASPSLTKTWHKDTYAATNPSKRAELSLRGKTVVITGGGSGIGKGLARAFADAGAARIVILGRRGDVLRATKQEIEAQNEEVAISVHVADVADLASIGKTASLVGKWDVLVSNAGYLPEIKPLVVSDPVDWWKGFEVNVKGPFNLIHAFLPNRRPQATLIGVSAGSIQVRAMSANWSSYNSSKFAGIKMLESVAAEMPDVHVVSMHPGVIESDMSAKAMPGKANAPQMDTVELPSDFAVWLCSQEAKFLRGKFVWCKWDVEELQAKKAEIEGSLLLTPNCIGWPYTP